jgi:hypothetical protein
LVVKIDLETWKRSEAMRVTLAELRGARIVARVAEGGYQAIDGQTVTHRIGPDSFVPPLTSELLAAVPDPILLWWVELEHEGRTTLRSPYAVLTLE